MRGVPNNQGTSATGAVAWGGVGRLIDPSISNSTGRRLEVTFDHHSMILRMLLSLFEFLVCQVLGFNRRTNCREGENSKASPSLAWPGIVIHRRVYGPMKKFPSLQHTLKHVRRGGCQTVPAAESLDIQGMSVAAKTSCVNTPDQSATAQCPSLNKGPLIACTISTGVNDADFWRRLRSSYQGSGTAASGGATGCALSGNIRPRSEAKVSSACDSRLCNEFDHVSLTTEIQTAHTLFLRDRRSVPACVLLKNSHAVAHCSLSSLSSTDQMAGADSKSVGTGKSNQPTRRHFARGGRSMNKVWACHILSCVVLYVVMHYISANIFAYEHYTSQFLELVWRYVTTLISFRSHHGVQALGSLYPKLLCVPKVPSVGILSVPCCSGKITLNRSLPEVRPFPFPERLRL